MNDTFIPWNLRQGHIIRCFLPTEIGPDDTQHAPRNALVLGLEYDPAHDAVKGLYLIRFSYNTGKFSPDWEWNISEAQAEGQVRGLWKPAVLRTNRIDLVPADPVVLGPSLRIVGEVDPSLFPLIDERLRAGLAGPDAETSRGEHMKGESSIVVPALVGETAAYSFSSLPAMSVLKAAPPIEESDYDRALAQAKAQRRDSSRMPQANRDPIYLDSATPTPMPPEAWHGVISLRPPQAPAAMPSAPVQAPKNRTWPPRRACPDRRVSSMPMNRGRLEGRPPMS